MGKKGGRIEKLTSKFAKFHCLVMSTHVFRQETAPSSFPDLPEAIITIAFALSEVIKRKKERKEFPVFLM